MSKEIDSKSKTNQEIIYVKKENKEENLENKDENLDKKKKKIKWVIIITSSVLILIGIGIALYYILPKKSKDDILPPPSNSSEPIIPTEEKIKTEFSFKNEVDDYKRIFIHQGYNETMVVNGKEINLFLERKTTAHIYIISESKPKKEHEKFYSTMYTVAIAIGNECISSTKRDCEPINEVDPFFNADIKELQSLKQSDLEDIAFPLCIFNITDNDVITSIKCPESMSDGKIKGIVLDLYFFRPPAIQRPDKQKNNVTIDKQNLENNQTFIIERNGGQCDLENPFNSFCTTEMNTTIDDEGNLISYDEIAFIEVKNDELNSYKKIN